MPTGHRSRVLLARKRRSKREVGLEERKNDKPGLEEQLTRGLWARRLGCTNVTESLLYRPIRSAVSTGRKSEMTDLSCRPDTDTSPKNRLRLYLSDVSLECEALLFHSRSKRLLRPILCQT